MNEWHSQINPIIKWKNPNLFDLLALFWLLKLELNSRSWFHSISEISQQSKFVYKCGTIRQFSIPFSIHLRLFSINSIGFNVLNQISLINRKLNENWELMKPGTITLNLELCTKWKRSLDEIWMVMNIESSWVDVKKTSVS